MRILYGYSNCSDKLYKKITAEKNAAVLMPDQKYHELLIRGLAEHVDAVHCISGLPVNREVTDSIYISEADEIDGNIQYHYISTLNLPLLRQLMIFCGTFWRVLKEKKNDTYAICDCLNLANAYGMVIACKLRRIPVVTIVTDLPEMMRTSGFMRSINKRLFDKVDGFVLLTEQMNDRVNRKSKPYAVIEGHVDGKAASVPLSEKYEKCIGKKVALYAGSLLTLYGVQNLVEGFLQAGIADAELWVYGDGDYREELEAVCKEHTNMKYLGVRANSEIVEAEMKAALLVNPRPSTPEYTKYSFPSKNMEYMVSGTPVLTTKLPGMPEDYFPFVYFIEDESSRGIAEALTHTLSESIAEREQKGQLARAFVLAEKSNTVQAGKIIQLLSEMRYEKKQ